MWNLWRVGLVPAGPLAWWVATDPNLSAARAPWRRPAPPPWPRIGATGEPQPSEMLAIDQLKRPVAIVEWDDIIIWSSETNLKYVGIA